MKLRLFIPIIFLILLVPTLAYAITDTSEEGFYKECEPKAFGFMNIAMDFICWLDLYKMWSDINILFGNLVILNDDLINTNVIINERIDSVDEAAGKAMAKAESALKRADNQNRRIMVANSERAALSKEIEGMRSVVNEIFPIISKVGELDKRVSDSIDEVNNLSGEVGFISMDMEEAAAEIADLKSANVNLTGTITNMTSHISEMERRLNKVDPPDVDFTLNVEPKSVSGEEKFRVFGTATKSKNDLVSLSIRLPDNSKSVFSVSIFIKVQDDNTFSRDMQAGNVKWIMDGDYIIQGSHASMNTSLEVLLSYTRNSTGT